MEPGVQFEQIQWIGSNRYGYYFGVGLLDNRWVGFALAHLYDGDQITCVFHQVSEGVWLGLPDRDEAIRMTAAVAQDPESSYGGVDGWNVGAELQGDPEKYRCSMCCEIHTGPCDEEEGEWTDEPID